MKILSCSCYRAFAVIVVDDSRYRNALKVFGLLYVKVKYFDVQDDVHYKLMPSILKV